MADVEQHAAFARLQHHLLHRALRGGRRVGKRPEGMGQNVARTQACDHLLIARRRMVDMRHQRHADLLGDLKRDVERHDSRGARGVLAYPHLDADDEVAIILRHLDRVDRIHQPELLALADHDPMREAEDAGMRDVQISENAHLTRLDHVLAEAREIARAGAAGVNRRGNAGGAAELLGIDAKRGAAPIDMGVQIDKAGGDDVTRHVAHVGSGVDLERGSDRDHLAVGEGYVHHGVELLGRVDHPTAAQHQIESHCHLRDVKAKEAAGTRRRERDEFKMNRYCALVQATFSCTAFSDLRSEQPAQPAALEIIRRSRGRRHRRSD